jgi:hypothetical protein
MSHVRYNTVVYEKTRVVKSGFQEEIRHSPRADHPAEMSDPTPRFWAIVVARDLGLLGLGQ